jgi:hypothetical protein
LVGSLNFYYEKKQGKNLTNHSFTKSDVIEMGDEGKKKRMNNKAVSKLFLPYKTIGKCKKKPFY